MKTVFLAIVGINERKRACGNTQEHQRADAGSDDGAGRGVQGESVHVLIGGSRGNDGTR